MLTVAPNSALGLILPVVVVCGSVAVMVKLPAETKSQEVEPPTFVHDSLSCQLSVYTFGSALADHACGHANTSNPPVTAATFNILPTDLIEDTLPLSRETCRFKVDV
jgi:hypothetical protein